MSWGPSEAGVDPEAAGPSFAAPEPIVETFCIVSDGVEDGDGEGEGAATAAADGGVGSAKGDGVDLWPDPGVATPRS
jgi:hypothetical protein